MNRLSALDRRLRVIAPISGPAPRCPLCLRPDDMAPSLYGHPSILVCVNPSCIYQRTQAKSASIVAEQARIAAQRSA